MCRVISAMRGLWVCGFLLIHLISTPVMGEVEAEKSRADWTFEWPRPLSQVFLPGGALAGWDEDLVLITAGVGILALLDIAVVQRKLAPGGRYFALHAVANAVATVAAFPDVVRGFMEPETSWTGPSQTMVANSAISAIHIYHCLAFKLSTTDIVHHAVFVSILCGLGIAFKDKGGIANNFGCFFLSGLPGGLDYAFLVLKAEGYVTKLQEKRWNRWLQQWLRGPAMSIYAFIAFTAYRTGNTAHLPAPIVLLVASLHFVNGIYYADEAVGSWYTWKERMDGANKSK